MHCGIDPGYDNCAFAVVNPHTAELLDCGVRRLGQVHRNDDAEFAVQCSQYLNEVCARNPNIDVLRVEHQGMSRQLAVIEGSLVAAAACNGVRDVGVVHPQSVKAHFKGLGCRGHAQNKVDAERLVKKMGYGNLVNHVADALLIALYSTAT